MYRVRAKARSEKNRPSPSVPAKHPRLLFWLPKTLVGAGASDTIRAPHHHRVGRHRAVAIRRMASGADLGGYLLAPGEVRLGPALGERGGADRKTGKEQDSPARLHAFFP